MTADFSGSITPGTEKLDNDMVKVSVPSIKALCVDDNDISLMIEVETLKSMGIDAEGASGGQEALDLCHKVNYDIVFMDHFMPEMDGPATVRTLRTFHSYKDTPIIALTGNEGDSSVYAEAGMNGHLPKPLDAGELARVLNKWLPGFEGSRQTDTQPQETDIAGQFEDLDVKSALKKMEGKEAIYIAVLQTFASTAEARADTLMELSSRGNWEQFRIAVHGIKSALANIGAVRLSEQARRMELLTGAGEVKVILPEIPPFCREIVKLSSDIASRMETKIKSSDEIAGKQEYEALYIILPELQRHISRFETDEIESKLDELMKYTYGIEVDEGLREVKNSIFSFDYDTADDILNTLISRRVTQDD